MDIKVNEVNNLLPVNAKIDLEKIDIEGFNHPIEALRMLQEVTKGKTTLGVYQCRCGKIFFFPNTELSKVKDRVVNNTLLCNSCSPKKAKIDFKVVINDPKEEAIKSILSKIFSDARTKNRLSFSYYLWNVLSISKKVDVMLDNMSTFQSVIARISSEDLIKKMGGKLPDIVGGFHEKTSTVLMLMVYCHFHETTDLLDILYVLLLISTSEYRSVCTDDRGSPAFRVPPEGLIETDVYKKIPIIMKLSKKGGYKDLEKLLKDIYKPYIRNAVYHSQYEITNESIIFRYKINYEDKEYVEKIISKEEFSLKYRKMVTLFIGMLEGIMKERDDLIKQGEVKEGGLTLTPISKGDGFSVKIEWKN